MNTLRSLVPSVVVALAAVAGLNAAALAAAADVLHLTLRSEVRVPAEQPMTLGDIATGSGGRFAEAKQVTIATAPTAGRLVIIDRPLILAALRAAGFDLGQVSLGGAVRLRAFGAGQALDAARVRAAVEELLRQNTTAPVQARLLGLQLPEGIAVAPGEYEVRASLPPGGLRSGVQRVPLEIRESHQPPKQSSAEVKLELSGPLVVAARDVGRGERLAPSDLRLETRAYPPGQRVLSEVSLQTNSIARSPLRQGEPVPPHALGHAAAVEPGQAIKALFRQGAVAVDIDTRARSGGEIGKLILVDGLDGKPIKARIVAPGRAVVVGSDEILATEPVAQPPADLGPQEKTP